jgi:hypothetical protein
MKLTIRHIIFFLIISLQLLMSVKAQRVSFGLYATDDLVLTPLNLSELNFNQKQPFIIAGQTITINMTDDASAVLTIEGRTDLDINVTIDAPSTLDLDVTNKVPFALKFSYSNIGASNELIAKASAIEVPPGFTSATFPILRRASNLPAPPPTPNHIGYSAPTRTAYLFLYGTLGPVSASSATGFYTGNINIHVEYAKY